MIYQIYALTLNNQTEKAKDQYVLRTLLVFTDNQKYIQRGRDLYIPFNPDWEKDLKKINRSKEGAPFQYADALIMSAALFRTATGISLRLLQGLLSMMLGVENTPSYVTLWRRMKDLTVDINNNIATIKNPKKSMTLIADSTGIKQYNRGEWIRQKWKVERGFIKLHLLVDKDTKKILAAVVTDDSTGDSPMLKEFLGKVVTSESH